MLNVFRQKGLTSAVYGVIIVATVVIFVVQFRPGAQGRGSGSLQKVCAAEVRGECIEPRAYSAALALVAPGRSVDAARLRSLSVRKQVVEGLVERQLLVHDAERLGLALAEDEVDNELVSGRAHVSVPAAHIVDLAYPLGLGRDLVRVLPVTDPKTKAFDYKTYDKVVRQFTGRSPPEFKATQRLELLAAKMRDLVRSRVHVSDAEAWEAFEQDKSKATIRYAKIDRAWIASRLVDRSPDAVAAWTKAHEAEVAKLFESRKAHYLPECRVTRHILVKLEPAARPPTKAAAREKIDAAVARLAKGDEFADVARDVSDDGSAAEGGSLGCIQRGQMVKPFEDAAFALEAGKVSDVVETQFGLHVLRVDRVLKDADAEAYGRAEAARELMVAQDGDELAAESAKRILAAVKAGKSLDDAVAAELASLDARAAKLSKKGQKVGAAAKDARPRVEVSASFASDGEPISGAASNAHVADTAFRLAKKGDAPDDVVKLDDGYAVFTLDEKSTVTRDDFAKERERYLEMLTTMRQADALAVYVERLRDAAKNDVKVNEAFTKAPETEAPAGDEE